VKPENALPAKLKAFAAIETCPRRKKPTSAEVTVNELAAALAIFVHVDPEESAVVHRCH
jgi:hypothetical protein